MSEPLKPVSALARKYLALLGETPAQHQAQMQSIIKKTYTRANATEKVPNVHALNRTVERRLTWSAPSSELAANLERKTFVAEEWLPDAYVLFQRRWRCRCGSSGSCMDRSELFLRHRRVHQRHCKEQENGPPILYLPVKVLVYQKLPRLREVVFRACSVCDECFDEVQGVTLEWPKAPSASPQAPTESSGSGGTTLFEHLSAKGLFSEGQSPQEFTISQLATALSDSKSEPQDLPSPTPESGCASLNSSDASLAPAPDTHTHIEEAHPNV